MIFRKSGCKSMLVASIHQVISIFAVLVKRLKLFRLFRMKQRNSENIVAVQVYRVQDIYKMIVVFGTFIKRTFPANWLIMHGKNMKMEKGSPFSSTRQ